MGILNSAHECVRPSLLDFLFSDLPIAGERYCYCCCVVRFLILLFLNAEKKKKKSVKRVFAPMGKHSAAAEEEEEGGRRRRGASEDGNNTNNNNNLECLYSGDRTKPIKTMKDKFELLPAFLKVRGLGARQIFVLFVSLPLGWFRSRCEEQKILTTCNTNLFTTTLWNNN